MAWFSERQIVVIGVESKLSQPCDFTLRVSLKDPLCIISVQNADDEDERLKIRFTQLSEVKVETLEVSTAELNFQSFRANLHTGTIAIDPSKNTIPENIALVLSICVLHVLCAPENSERRIKSRGKYHSQPTS